MDWHVSADVCVNRGIGSSSRPQELDWSDHWELSSSCNYLILNPRFTWQERVWKMRLPMMCGKNIYNPFFREFSPVMILLQSQQIIDTLNSENDERLPGDQVSNEIQQISVQIVRLLEWKAWKEFRRVHLFPAEGTHLLFTDQRPAIDAVFVKLVSTGQCERPLLLIPFRVVQLRTISKQWLNINLLIAMRPATNGTNGWFELLWG